MADGRLIFDTSINTSGFQKDLSSLERQTNITSSSITKGILGADFLKRAGSEILEFGKDSVTAASSLEEIQNVIDVTFGDNSDKIRDWAKTAKESYGIAETAALKYAGQFGTLFKTAGLADEQVLQYTKDLVGLGGDFASFWDNDIDVSLTKILSALKGETEAINDYGIDVRIAALSAFTGRKMEGASRLEQLVAIYGKLMADTTAVQGDFLRTNESFANQARILETNLQQFQAQIGNVMLPMGTLAISMLNEIFDPQIEVTVNDKLKSVSDELDTLNNSAKTANDAFAETEALITGKGNIADEYLDTLELLQSNGINTDQDVQAMENAIAGLQALYPELEKYFDGSTSVMELNTQAIRDNIAELQNLALTNLYAEELQDNAARTAQAVNQMAAAGIALDEAQAKLGKHDSVLDKLGKLESQLLEGDYSQIGASFDAVASLIPALNSYYERDASGRRTLIEGIGMPDITQILPQIGEAREALITERQALEQAVADAQSSVADTQQMLADAETNRADIEARQARVAAIMAGEGAAMASATAEGVTDNAGEVTSAVDSMNQQAAKTDTSIYYNAGRKAAHQYAMGLRSVAMPTLKPGTPFGGGAGVDGSHATGINYVPYDNYIARLHVGEAVLNASEARAWRSGESAAETSTDLPSSAYASPKAKTVINIDGQKVAEIQGYNNSRQIAIQNNRHAKGVGGK